MEGIDFGELVQALAMIVGGLAILTRFTPNPTDDRVVSRVLQLLNVLGGKRRDGGSGVGPGA